MSAKHQSDAVSGWRRQTSCTCIFTSLFLAGLIIGIAASSAGALSFEVDFRNSTYDTQVGDTFSILLAQHQTETVIQSTVTQGLENVTGHFPASFLSVVD